MPANISRRFRFVLARVMTAALALAALAWAFAVIPVFSSQAAITEVAAHILAGETYSSTTMDAVTAAIQRDPQPTSRGAYLSKIAIVRLRNVENAIKLGERNAINESMASLHAATDLALANSPDESFLWLVRFWSDNTANGITPAQLQSLRMSYKLGPREGWIATKRSGIVLGNYSRLPADIGEQAASEFSGLVSSAFYTDAALVLAGPGWPVRKLLLAKLGNLTERDRRLFARQLYDKDVEDAAVPGVEPQAPRPFR